MTKEQNMTQEREITTVEHLLQFIYTFYLVYINKISN